MTAAYRLKGLGWFGGVVIVSLGFYLISLQVAAERKHLDQVNAKIGSAERETEAPTPRMMKAVVVKAVAPAPLTTASLRKSKTVAMLDSGLLSDTTLGDLVSGARAERGRRR